MGSHIVTSMLWCGLISLSLGVGNVAAGQVDPQRAEAYFKEAAAICQRDGGRLWGVSLCGPMVIADARTGTIATSQPAPAAERPRTFGFANAPVEWGGSRWVALVWDFTASLPDASTRGELMLHELFHRIQPQLGLLTPGGATQNAHLDTFEGRFWLRLEWRALVRALGSSGDVRTRAVRDALAFRARRRSLFREAAENERRDEIREGIAHYTGIVATAASRSEAIARTIAHVTGAEGHDTFLQQSYTTGTAYAVLLDDASADWRRRVRGDSDLGQMLMAALNVRPAADAAEASARYGGVEIRAAEQTRAERRRVVVRELQRRFVEGPVLLVPSGGGATFNAVGATPIPGAGTVYVLPYNAKGQWGTLDAPKGVLVGDDGTRRVPGPVRIDGTRLTGDGWTLTVAPGWTVRPGARSSDYEIVREVQSAPTYLDHIIVAIDSLDRGIALLKELTGIAPVVGGVHPGRGTQNALLSLGAGRYLELLAPNPADRMGPAAVASHAKYRALTPVGWAARTANADSLRAALVARGEQAGDVRAGSRELPDGRTLRWRTLAPWPGGRENLLPFFIEWAAGGPHPSTDAPTGCTLESMRFIAVTPDSVRGHLANAAIHVAVTPGTADRMQIELRCGARTVSLPPAP